MTNMFELSDAELDLVTGGEQPCVTGLGNITALLAGGDGNFAACNNPNDKPVGLGKITACVSQEG